MGVGGMWMGLMGVGVMYVWMWMGVMGVDPVLLYFFPYILPDLFHTIPFLFPHILLFPHTLPFLYIPHVHSLNIKSESNKPCNLVRYYILTYILFTVIPNRRSPSAIPSYSHTCIPLINSSATSLFPS